MRASSIVSFALLTLAGIVAVAVPDSALPILVLAFFVVVLAVAQSLEAVRRQAPVDAGAALDAATQEVEHAVRALLRSTTPVTAVATAGKEPADNRDGFAEHRRRRAIEQLIVASVRWGWQMARRGLTVPPAALIEWTGSDEPRLVAGRSDEP